MISNLTYYIPKSQRFYRWEHSVYTAAFRMRMLGDLPDWPSDQLRLLTRGKLHLEATLTFEAYRGVRAADILGCILSYPFFFSPRLLALLEGEGITGYSTFPVDLYSRDGSRLEGYAGVAITGPECRRDRSRSQIIEKPAPVPTGKNYFVYRGLHYDESQWDGSDFFWVTNGGGIVVTHRVFDLVHWHKIRNVKLTPLQDVEINMFLDRYFVD